GGAARGRPRGAARADGGGAPRDPVRGGVRSVGRLALRWSALAYLGVVLVAPLALIFWRAFADGVDAFWSAISTPEAVHALWLTAQITLITVPLNTVFGVIAALVIVRRRVPGRTL